MYVVKQLPLLIEFTAATISSHYDRYVRPHFAELGKKLDLFVCGGGAKNQYMMT
jgi:1,6-anhydro-N-acetylmuramate kinase